LIVKHKLEEIKKDLNEKAEQVLTPHLLGHPITYNHYLISNVQEVQANRNRKPLEWKLKEFFHIEEIGSMIQARPFNMAGLLDALAEHTEPDMDRHSCAMAIDMMQVHYKVSHTRKRPVWGRQHEDSSNPLFCNRLR